MAHPDKPTPTESGHRGLTIESLGAARLPALFALARQAWDRSRSPESLAWRYEHCPSLEASLAMHGEECVACVFALRRTYWTPAGAIECLEPFDWFTAEAWRPKGAGLRAMKRFMSGSRPLFALGGSVAAQNLFTRLGWRPFCTTNRLVLPLTGRFLEWRGRGALLARGFDLTARRFYAPRRPMRSPLRVEPATSPGPALGSIVQRQRRFDCVPRPDLGLLRWLRAAPPEMGLYLGFNLLVRDAMVGWAWARVLTAGGLRFADLQDLLLADEARDLYPVAVRHVTAALAGFDVDAIFATTSCPDTLTALTGARFRFDDALPVYAWWPGQDLPTRALIMGSHAEHAFFPSPTSSESAWAASPSDG